jgi:hypothetical protein
MGTSHTSDLQWYSGYLFGYTNAGYYSIWRMKATEARGVGTLDAIG